MNNSGKILEILDVIKHGMGGIQFLLMVLIVTVLFAGCFN